MALPFIAIAVAVVAALVTWRARRARYAAPAAVVTVASWLSAAHFLTREGYTGAAVVCVSAAVGVSVIAVFLIADGPTVQSIRRSPGPCPSWCEFQHHNAPAQEYVVHGRVVGGHDLEDGGIVEVFVSWYERLTGPASPPPSVQVVLLTGDHDRSVQLDLTGDEAGLLASILAADWASTGTSPYTLAFSGATGWLPRALAQAADALGYQDATVPAP